MNAFGGCGRGHHARTHPCPSFRRPIRELVVKPEGNQEDERQNQKSHFLMYQKYQLSWQIHEILEIQDEILELKEFQEKIKA